MLCFGADLSRWQRIAVVRDLSTAAAGEETGELGKIGMRYARLAKSSTEEQTRARQFQASQIFARQASKSFYLFPGPCQRPGRSASCSGLKSLVVVQKDQVLDTWMRMESCWEALS